MNVKLTEFANELNVKGRKKSRMTLGVIPEQLGIKWCHRDRKDMESSWFEEMVLFQTC